MPGLHPFKRSYFYIERHCWNTYSSAIINFFQRILYKNVYLWKVIKWMFWFQSFSNFSHDLSTWQTFSARAFIALANIKEYILIAYFCLCESGLLLLLFFSLYTGLDIDLMHVSQKSHHNYAVSGWHLCMHTYRGVSLPLTFFACKRYKAGQGHNNEGVIIII